MREICFCVFNFVLLINLICKTIVLRFDLALCHVSAISVCKHLIVKLVVSLALFLTKYFKMYFELHMTS